MTLPESSRILQKRMEKFADVDLYPVITEAFCNGRKSEDVLRACLDAGIKIVQLREKHLSKGQLYSLAESYRRLTTDAGALLIINDHLDVALAVDADGVHLGQSDLPVDAARRIAPDTILGASTHNPEQMALAAKQGASYINIGPIYATGTKPEHKTFLGPEILAQWAPLAPLPFTVMGGIKIDNVEPVIAAGARHIAVVTAVTAADDIEKATRAFREKINSLRT